MRTIASRMALLVASWNHLCVLASYSFYFETSWEMIVRQRLWSGRSQESIFDQKDKIRVTCLHRHGMYLCPKSRYMPKHLMKSFSSLGDNWAFIWIGSELSLKRLIIWFYCHAPYWVPDHWEAPTSSVDHLEAARSGRIRHPAAMWLCQFRASGCWPDEPNVSSWRPVGSEGLRWERPQGKHGSHMFARFPALFGITMVFLSLN